MLGGVFWGREEVEEEEGGGKRIGVFDPEGRGSD